MQLTLAGPGAGKTTDMIKQIITKVPDLQANRDMAIITYTNESVNDIKRKISKELCLSQNIFIGTMHSFLIHYFILPYAFILGYKSNPITIVDEFNKTGMEWIDDWTKNKFSDRNTREIKKQGLYQKHYKMSRESAAKNGIYTYDSIVKIAKDIAAKKEICKLISNKIQFLFVDEYQDISKYGHEIIMNLEKQKLTEIAVVGDPDQSIYRFRYGNSQIGERAPTENKQPIRELMSMESKGCDVRTLLVNHRSSKEIVEFNNKYGTLQDQLPEKDSVCNIQYMRFEDSTTVIKRMMKIAKNYGCSDYLLLGKKKKTVDCCKTAIENEKLTNGFIDLKTITDFIVAKTGLTYKSLLEGYGLDRHSLRHIAAELRKENNLNQLDENSIIRKARDTIKKLYGISVEFRDSFCSDASGKRELFNYSKNWDASADKNNFNNIRFMTIHKSKGLEADCVLVIAETEHEFFKWYNMTPEEMKSLKDEDFRLGYVAFTRAKKVLILTCLQNINENMLDKDTVKILAPASKTAHLL